MLLKIKAITLDMGVVFVSWGLREFWFFTEAGM